MVLSFSRFVVVWLANAALTNPWGVADSISSHATTLAGAGAAIGGVPPTSDGVHGPTGNEPADGSGGRGTSHAERASLPWSWWSSPVNGTPPPRGIVAPSSRSRSCRMRPCS